MKIRPYDFEYKRTKEHLTCKLCQQRISCNDFLNHIRKEHSNEMTYQEYFEKFYCIPANNLYELPNIDYFLILIRDYYLRRHNKSELVTVENVKKHFERALKENNYSIISFYWRFYQRHYELCKYLNLQYKKHQRLKRAEMDALGIPHKDTKQLQPLMSRHQCPICGQEQYASHFFKHIVTVHKMSKHDCLVKYFNIPDSADTENLSFTMLLNMQKELNQSSYNNYVDLYNDIVNQYSNIIELKQEMKYDVIPILKALHIPLKTYSTLNWDCSNNSNLYVGYRKDLNASFRSTWEANIARILNLENIKYEFESYKFTLQDGKKTMTYIPDFYLPDTDTYIEVKGYWRNYKVQLFRQQYPNKFLVIIDKPIYTLLKKEYMSKIKMWED